MSRIALYFINFSAAVLCCSALYYLTLVLALPFLLFILAACSVFYGAYKLQEKLTANDAGSSTLPFHFSLILLLGAGWMLTNSSSYYQKFGGWDAFAMFNYHARFMTDPIVWDRFYLTKTFDHPDYPLGLPGIIAAVWRATNHMSPVVPLIISWWAMLAIPVTLSATLYKRSGLVALAVLWYFCKSDIFLKQGIAEYADLLVGFFFLCCFVTENQYKITGNKAFIVLCGACAGAAAWTKNEGLMLAGLFMVFHFRTLAKKKTLIAFLCGCALPVTAILVHKIGYAPNNDLISHPGENRIFLLRDKARLITILDYLKTMMWESFRPMVYTIGVYMAWCILKRRFPNRPILAVFAGLLVYMLVYMLTPYSLEWHLKTSFDRLIMQLLPTFIYAIGHHITEKWDSRERIKIVLNK